MKAMILAAGRGTRLRPLTDVTPKPLLKIDKFALIEHLLFRLKENGFTEIVINLAHLGDKIEAVLANGQQYGVDIIYSREGDNGGLETGGGIHNALPLLGDDPFLVVSGDIWTDYNFANLRERPLTGLAHLILVDNPSYKLEGDFSLLDGQLGLQSENRLTYGNIGVYHPNLFSDCMPGVFRLGPLIKKAVQEGQATGEYFQGNWVNVGTAEILTSLRKRLQSEKIC